MKAKTMISVLIFFSNLLLAQNHGERLYNGIHLPPDWPPQGVEKSNAPISVPYLQSPPAVIPIDVGRQLFVDDFLIEKTTCKRTYHPAIKYKQNPVLSPQTELEMDDGKCPVAAPFNDGIWYDPQDNLFKMWYHAGWFAGTGYATSGDGIHWQRPNLDVVAGSNQVLKIRPGYTRDGCTVWLDKETNDPKKRFKMFIYHRFPGDKGGEIYTSPDGIHWRLLGPTGKLGDNSGFFYNPFRQKWVFSIRSHMKIPVTPDVYHRTRDYHEASDFQQAAQWQGRPNPAQGETRFWQRTDSLDLPDPVIGDRAQLYNVDAVAYESIMLGLFAIHRGPPNRICAFGGFPKITELNLGYSRDGFYFSRPDRRAFIHSSRKIGDWDRAYIHSAGGCCLVVGDSLYFYYGAWSGKSPALFCNMYAGGATGIAKLRRDGFSSMDADTKGGILITRPVEFTGNYLFVNVATSGGELTVEILNKDNKPIPPYTRENCIPVRTDKTLQSVRWRFGDTLSGLETKTVKFKFYLQSGSLYSFWVSPDRTGASYGYVAAGGPGFTGNRDTVGIGAY